MKKNVLLDIQVGNIDTCFEDNNSHFKSIYIEEYNIFKNFKIDELNRINIFAGCNNSGKTTFLEAIYLLVNQNNIGSFFNVIKSINKLNALDTICLNDCFNNKISIFGEFNDVKTNISIAKYEANIDKKDDYLSSYKIVSKIDNCELDNIVHTFKNNPIQRFYDKVEILCSNLYKSPYFYNQKEIINTHSKNVELKVLNLIVEFIKNNIDDKINNIELTEKNDIKRFLVDSETFPEKSVDITNYGDGLQRIFEIALAFAYCRNGVLLIDELETAIHYSLLIDFTKFIQELAIKFNVQVFITTHSKECINAFIENEVCNEDISFYLMTKNKQNQIQTIIYDNEILADELSQNLEVRGW